MSKTRPFEPLDSGYFSVDDASGQLFWRNKEIKTATRVSLTVGQGVLAVVTALSAALAAGAASVSAWVALETLEGQKAEQTQSPAAPLSPLRISIFSTHFDSGRDRPTSQSLPTLANALQVLADNPRAKAVIRAYTDNAGSADLNRRLAQARAANVRQFLTGSGIPPARITVKSPAADTPRADNSTPAGRAQNRRVEIEIITTPVSIPATAS